MTVGDEAGSVSTVWAGAVDIGAGDRAGDGGGESDVCGVCSINGADAAAAGSGATAGI